MTNLKKMMAALTAAMCMTAMMPISVIAEETESTIPVTEFVVTGVGENGLILMFSGDTYTYSFPISNITSCNEMPEYGDIIEIEGYWEVTELGWATNYMTVYPDLMGGEASCNVTVTGSLFEAGTEEICTISTIKREYGYGLTNADGKEFRYEDDYLSPESQPGGYRWEYAEIGDEVTMLVYEGVPCIPQTVDTCQMAVIAENAEGDFIMMNVSDPDSTYTETFYLTEELIAQHYVGDDEIQYGDIIEFPNETFFSTVLDGTNECGFMQENEKMWKIGSLYEDGIREQVTVETTYEYGRGKVTLDDRTYSLYLYNVALGGYTQPDGVDWTAFAKGDTLSMYTYNGIPTIPASGYPLGDVNLDNTLDILDVIALNKSILAGAELPALMGARSGDLGHCDFNGNGTLDMDDSLGMLKRILHIEA